MSLIEAISRSENIIIIGHFNPDGDAVGSTMALKFFLENMGKNAQVMYPNRYAFNLSWMDTGSSAMFYNESEQKCKPLIKEADLVFCLDFQSISRTESMEGQIKESKALKVLVDHHIDPAVDEFDLCFSEIEVSSTCEKLYKTLVAEIGDKYIDKKVASCLYAGLCTDTGSFSFSCAHADLFLTVAELIKKGADTVAIHRAIFDTFSFSRMQLLGYCLNKKLVMLSNYKTAYISLTSNELNSYKYQSGDLEGVVNYALGMEGVVFAAFFTERNNRIRVSLRSKGNIDVNKFASLHFQGGGHKNAAGGSSFISLEETIKKFETLVPEFYEKEINKEENLSIISII